MFIATIAAGTFGYNDGQQIKQLLAAHSVELQKQEQQTAVIENYDSCIANFFLQQERTNITIAQLPSCQPIINKVK